MDSSAVQPVVPVPPTGSGEPPSTGVSAGAFATIWLALFLDLLAFGIIIPVLPFYATHHGASPAVVALLSTTFSLSQFVMSPILGRISDQYGRRPVMLVSIGGSIASMLVLGFAGALWMVFVARLVSGACNANVSTANAYVADRVAPRERARYMGMMGSAIGMGFVFGPALGGLLSSDAHPERPFLFAAGLAAVNWVMAFFLLPESRKPSAGGGAPRSIAPWKAFGRLADVRGTPLAAIVVVAFGFFFAFAAMESTFAQLTEARLGWDARHNGYSFSWIGVCLAASQALLLPRLVRRFGERRTLVIGLVVQGTGLVFAGLGGDVFAFIVAGTCVACGNGLVSPSTSAIVSRVSNADDQGLNLGIVQSASALARIIGPAVAGVLFEHVGHGAPMLAGAVIVALVAIFVAPRIVLER
jgi:DHA1 family tetracycline resistance protein-like MFS transporter